MALGAAKGWDGREWVERWAGLALLTSATITFLVSPSMLLAQACVFPAGGTLGGVVNTYHAGAIGTSAASSRFVTVDTTYVRGSATAIAAGDLLLIIQMQDADINDTNTECYGDGSDEAPAGCGTAGNGSGSTIFNSGLYEFVVAEAAIGAAFAPGGCAAAAGRICITGGGTGSGLINGYTTQPRDGTGGARRGQQTYQVVRVARYSSATLGSTLTAYAWDGRVGGLLSVDVAGALALGGATVSVNGLGFRGGIGLEADGGAGGTNLDYVNLAANAFHGLKGEGIAGTPNAFGVGVPGGTGTDGIPQGDRARGAPGNAGGGGTNGNPAANDQNAGGGGGANAGAGGMGGNTWNSNLARGGFGGAAFPGAIARMVMGGGGGAGDRNNSAGIESSGGAGGGIVLIRATSVTGNGTITANGLPGVAPTNDGGGGGGAGGSVIVVAASGGLAGLVATAAGGNGSNAWPTMAPGGTPGERHGPGGGGGGGLVLLSAAPTTAPSVTGGTRGTTTTAADPFGATSGGTGTSALTTFVAVPGVETCLAVTRATLGGLRVLPGAVEFVTGSQRGTLGFNVYAAESRNGEKRRLNEHLVMSPARDTSRPVLYRVESGPVSEPYLFIEELESSGRRRWLGPFAVGDEELERAFDEVVSRGRDEEWREGRGAWLSTGRRHHKLKAAKRWRTRFSSAQGVKLEVGAAGHVSVPLADLVAQGLPEAAAARPEGLRLSNLGQNVPLRVVSGTLEFDSEALATDYTSDNVYVLTWGGRGAQPPRPQVDLTRSGFARRSGLLRVEQDLFYAPFLPFEADPWVWDFLVSGFDPGPYSFDVAGLLPGQSGPVEVRIGLSGASEHAHAFEAWINGVFVGRTSFVGKRLGQIKATLPAQALRETGNELRLVYSATVESPDEVGFAALDVLDLGVRVAPPSGHVAVDLEPYDTSLPGFRGVDYLIVTHADFLDQAQRIGKLKEAEGHKVAVVDVERAYDRFSAGVFEAEAVHELIRQAKRAGRLEYVLLVGDDSFDPRNHAGEGLTSYLPSLDGYDGEFGRVPSENRYADLDGDARPDVAIGRLPVQTLEQAEVLVDKIARQAEVLKAASGRHLFAVDQASAGDISFQGEALAVKNQLPPGSMLTWVDAALGAVQARQELWDALLAGPQMTHYFGHAGWDRWSNEALLRSTGVSGLAGTRRETLLFTWACEAQWYRWDEPTVNEALLLVPEGGALASLGPVGISDPALQKELAQRVYAHFLGGMSLGKAVRKAKAEAIKANPQNAPVVDGFCLLGDPALRLDLGGGEP